MNVNTRVEVAVEEVEATTVASSASTTLMTKGFRLFAMRKLTISTIHPEDNEAEEVVSVVALEEIEESTEVVIEENVPEVEEEAVEKDHGLNVSTEVVEMSEKQSLRHPRVTHQDLQRLNHNQPHNINES